MDCPPIIQFCLNFLLRSEAYLKECPPSTSIANTVVSRASTHSRVSTQVLVLAARMEITHSWVSAQARSLQSSMASAHAGSFCTLACQRVLASRHVPPNVATQRRGQQLAQLCIDSIRNKQLNRGSRVINLV